MRHEASLKDASIDSLKRQRPAEGQSAPDLSRYDAGEGARSFDGRSGRKSTGDKQAFDRQRHILVDALGLLLNFGIYPASVQGRDGAEALLRQLLGHFTFIEHTGGYQRPVIAALMTCIEAQTLKIVKCSDLHRLAPLPRRWMVKRALAWISFNRRLVRDCERHNRKDRFRLARHDPRHAPLSGSKSLSMISKFPGRR